MHPTDMNGYMKGLQLALNELCLLRFADPLFWTYQGRQRLMDAALNAVITNPFQQICSRVTHRVHEVWGTSDKWRTPCREQKMRRRVIRRGTFVSRCRRRGDFMPAAGVPAALTGGTAKALTARHGTRKSDMSGSGCLLRIKIGFIWQSCVEWPVVCTPKCQRRSIFTTSLIMVERPRIVIRLCYNWLRYVIVTLCGNIWASSFSLYAAQLVF